MVNRVAFEVLDGPARRSRVSRSDRRSLHGDGGGRADRSKNEGEEGSKGEHCGREVWIGKECLGEGTRMVSWRAGWRGREGETDGVKDCGDAVKAEGGRVEGEGRES